MPPTVGANVVEFTRTPHAAHVEFAIRWALVGQDHQADFVKARKAGRDGCPFVRRPLRFCHAPAPFRAVLIDHTQYTPAEGGGASIFCLSLPLKAVRLDLQPAAADHRRSSGRRLLRPVCDQPFKRRPRLNPAGIRDGSQRGQIRQRAARWVFPRLSGRARYPGQLRGLCLAQHGSLAPVAKPPLDGLPILSPRTMGKKRSGVHVFPFPGEKNAAQNRGQAHDPGKPPLLPSFKAICATVSSLSVRRFPSKPCKNQRSSAPISAAAVPFYASLPPRPAPFKAVLARTRAYTRARVARIG